MMETMIVYLIGLLAVLYVARKAYRSWQGKGGCGSCGGCGASKAESSSGCGGCSSMMEAKNKWQDVVVRKGLYIYWVVTKRAEEVSDYFFGSFCYIYTWDLCKAGIYTDAK